MKYFQKLKGERIYLSPCNSDDFEVYTRWMNDCGITDRLGNTWMSFDLEKESEFLSTMMKKEYHFAIVRYEGDLLLGNVSLFALNHVSQVADFGIFIGEPENRGKAYGVEAGRLVLDYGFRVLNLNNIMLRVFAFNKPAIACYEKLGFRKIGARRQAYYVNGQFHDEVYMDILREDFLA